MTMINSSQPVNLEKPTFKEMYEQQGGGSHQFVYHADGGRYFLSTVKEYELLRDELVEAQVRASDLRDHVYEWVCEWVRGDDITEEVAGVIADLFGFSLTRDVKWRATVNFYGDATIPVWDSEDTLNENIRFVVRWNGDPNWTVSGDEDCCARLEIEEA